VKIMIGKLEDHEINDIMSIWLQTTVTAHSFIPEKYWIESYDKVIEGYLPFSTTFTYKEDGIIKGFISTRDNSFIGALFVLKDYQGKSIGKKLINYCKSLYSSLELCVYVKNENAVNFYKNCGFVIKSKQPNENSGFMEYTMSWVKE